MATSFFLAFAMFGAIVYVALIYQGVLGIAAMNSGLLITPLMLGLIAASTASGFVMGKVAHYRYLGTAGALCMGIGLWLLALVGTGTARAEVVRDLVLVGLGIGTTMPLYVNAVMSALPQKYLGVASSQTTFWRNVGSTIGVAILGAVLSHELPEKVNGALSAAGLPPGAMAEGQSAQALFDAAHIAATRASLTPPGQAAFDQVIAAVRGALAGALHDVFIYAAAAAAIAVVLSLFLKEVPLRGRPPKEA